MSLLFPRTARAASRSFLREACEASGSSSSSSRTIQRLARLPPLVATARPSSRPFSSSSARRLPSDDPGGKPNDGSHSTVYDDFYNLLESNNPEEAPALHVDSITPTQVTLSDGLVCTSPIMVINNNCFLWDAPELDKDRAIPNGVGWEQWENGLEESFKLLEVIEPKPEILVLGTGDRVLPPPPKLRQYLNSMGIQVDAQSSQNAASAYNVLNEEGRKVAVALLPASRSPLQKHRPGEELAEPISTTSAPRTSANQPPPSPTSPRATPMLSSAQQKRSFATSTRTFYAAPAPSSSAQRPRRFPPPDLSKPQPTLQHFLLRSKALSLYRKYLRSSRGIPNPEARWESCQWYRHEFFPPHRLILAGGKDSLQDHQERLTQGGRMLKIMQGSMGLSDVGEVDEEGSWKGRAGYAKFRGARQTTQ